MNTRLTKTITAYLVCCMALVAVFSAYAETAKPLSTLTPEQEEVRARDYFTNLELINQEGETVRFFDDVLKDKVVVISFIFTNCQGACPLMTQKLTLVRDKMEGQVGAPLHFVSLSLDPARDTPAAMKAFAKTHHADHDGWLFLTGKPENLDYIIKQLGQFTEDIEAHSTMLLAGNVSTARWMKILPHEQPPVIAEKLQLLIEDNDPS